MILQIRKYMRDFIAVIVLFVIAMGVGGYILHNQRLRFPLVQESPFELKAAFSTAQAVIPGQGQTVRVSGVRIGDIAKVDLENGRAIVTMAVDPEYKDVVHTDASALLRPKTGLKDMFVELNPGSKTAPVVDEGFTIPVRNTLPDTNPDEVLALLDSDTRDYLKLLVSGAGQGLKGRGHDLQEVFRRFEPTHRDLARVTGKVAERHQHLRRLIHNLNVLNGELAGKDDELAQLVDSSAAVFRAFASEESNISRAVRRLPGALATTTDTLQKVEAFGRVLGPTADKLRPAVRELDSANKAITPFALEAAPILRNQVRPFVRGARPIVRDIRGPADRLAKSTPDLVRTFTVLNKLFNMVGYNRDGQEDPAKQSRDEGYLFWLAWLGHNGGTVFSSSDANGPFRPVTLGAPCSVIKQIVDEHGGEQLTMLLAPLLEDENVCGDNT